jgi:ketosteroid isomerase-like protein
MKITMASLCLLGLAMAANVAGAQSAKSPGATDIGGAGQAVLALEQKWLQSQKTNDTALLEPLLADNIADTSTEGKLMSGKAAVVKDARGVKWSSAEYIDMQVTVHGDAAIVTGIFDGKGTDTAGKPVNAHERFTDTWVKMQDGRWLCVASHGSNIAK